MNLAFDCLTATFFQCTLKCIGMSSLSDCSPMPGERENIYSKMTVVVSSKNSIAFIRKRIDDRTEFYPMLDYSFNNAKKLEDAFFAGPRVADDAPDVIKEGDRYYSHGINLNHNRLSGPLGDLPSLVQMTLVDPNLLSTLDLSFNIFTEIPSVINQFPSLKYLYFHKNLLNDLTEIRKLVSLNELKHFTLHSNPLEVNAPYLRSFVLCLLPDLRSFNCTPVSKADLHTSNAWKQINRHFLSQLFKKSKK